MWQVRTGPPGGGDHEKAVEDAGNRRLYAHPDRVEVRSIWAVDRAGISYDATVERGAGEVRRTARWPKPGSLAVTGAVPDALDRLVTTLLGVQMPARSRA